MANAVALLAHTEHIAQFGYLTGPNSRSLWNLSKQSVYGTVTKTGWQRVERGCSKASVYEAIGLFCTVRSQWQVNHLAWLFRLNSNLTASGRHRSNKHH